MNSKKITLKFTSIEFLLICFLAYYYLMPAAPDKISYLLILGVEILYSGFIFMRADKRARNTIIIYAMFILMVTLCYYFFTVTKSVSINVENYDAKRFLTKLNQLTTFFAPLILFYRINAIGTVKQKRFLIAFCFILIAYVVFNSYEYFADLDEISARMWENFEEMESDNIATYSYVYTVSAAIPLLFSVLLKMKQVWKKIIILMCIVFLYMFLLRAQYTLALIIPILCMILSLTTGAKKWVRILTILIMPLAILFLPNLLETLTLSIASKEIRTRLLAISVFFGGTKGAGDTLTGRLELYKLCIQEFMKSPLWGNKQTAFDGHATFLTVLCDVGLLGSVPFYYMYFTIQKVVKNILAFDAAKTMYIPVFIALIMMGFTNPIHASYSLAFMTCFIAPLVISFFNERKNEEKGR